MVEKTLWRILVITAFALTGCQTIQSNQPVLDSAIRHDPELVDEAPVVQNTYDSSQVVARLQREALLLQSQGRWSDAELLLERALRIDSQQIAIYEQLATVRMGQERFAEAEQIALKGLSISQQSAEEKVRLWRVVAQCRSAQSNIDGANAAREEVKKWQQ